MRPILFDLLDTLVDESATYKTFYSKIQKKYSLECDAQEFVDSFFSNQRKLIFANSRKPFKEVCECAFSGIIPHPELRDLELLYGLYAKMMFKEGITELLQKLKNAFDFYVFTNCSRDLVEKINLPGKCPVKFKRVFTSEDIGAYKPNPTAYERVVGFIGVPKEKII
ncbi:HAD family hydrolase [Candidatus Woesearchaeota archaeon]|nr:HAD family hydrolase [Candidatus Woesearchaeota archaeon]